MELYTSQNETVVYRTHLFHSLQELEYLLRVLHLDTRCLGVCYGTRQRVERYALLYDTHTHTHTHTECESMPQERRTHRRQVPHNFFLQYAQATCFCDRNACVCVCVCVCACVCTWPLTCNALFSLTSLSSCDRHPLSASRPRVRSAARRSSHWEASARAY